MHHGAQSTLNMQPPTLQTQQAHSGGIMTMTQGYAFAPPALPPALAYPPSAAAPPLIPQQPLQPVPHYAAQFAPPMHYGMQQSYSYYTATPTAMHSQGWGAMPMYSAPSAAPASLSQLQQLTHEQSMQLHHQRMQQQQIEMEHAAAAQAHDMQAYAHMQAQQHAAMMHQQQQQHSAMQQSVAQPLTKPPNMMLPTHLMPRPSGMYITAPQWQPQHPLPMHPTPLMYPQHAPLPMLQPTPHYSHFSSSGQMHPNFASPVETVTPASAASTAPVYAQSESSMSSPATRSTVAEPVVKLELPSAATTSAALASASSASIQKPVPSAGRSSHALTHTAVVTAAHPAAPLAKASASKIVAPLEMPAPVRISASHRKRRRPQHAADPLPAHGLTSHLRSPAAAAAAAASGSDDSFLARMDSRRMSKPTRERILQDAHFNCNIECGIRPSRWPPAAAAAAAAKAAEDAASSPAATTAAAASSISSGSSPPDAAESPPSAAALDSLPDDEVLDDEGYVVRAASDRVYSAYSSFFGGVVEMFVASSDPYPGRILFRAAALAHKAECSLNRVAMYLARQRGSEAGIFQALSFSRKLRGCPGLKRGGYFVSVLACEIYLERCKMLTHRKLLTPVHFRAGAATATATAEAHAPAKTRSGGLSALSTAASAVGRADSHEKAEPAAASAVNSPAASSTASTSSGATAAPARVASSAVSSSPLIFSRWQLYLGLDESGAGECTSDYPVDVFPPSLRQPPATATATRPSAHADRRASSQVVAAQDRAIESYLRHRLHQWTESFTARLAGLGDDEEQRDDAAADSGAADEAEDEEDVEEEEEE